MVVMIEGQLMNSSKRSAPRPRPRRLTAAQRREAMPRPLRILLDLAGAVGFGFAAGYIAHGPAKFGWPLTLAIGAGATAVFVLLRVAPRFVFTGAVVAFWLLMTPLLTWLFAAVTPEMGLDYAGRLAGLGLYALLVAVLAHRTSRGRPWFTTALALVVVTAVAAAAYRFQWHAGVWISYCAGLTVVVLRAGAGGWIRDIVDQVAEWWSTRSHRRVDLARWHDIRSAELATASTLGLLPTGHQVLHDRLIPGSVDDSYSIDHIVIGPAGITVIGSIALPAGAVTHRPDGSVWHRTRTLDKPLREAWWQARVVESGIGLPATGVLAIQGEATLAQPIHIGLFEHQGDADEVLQGAVTLVHGSLDQGQQLLAAIAAPREQHVGYSRGQVKRYSRRAARAFPAGRVAEPSGLSERSAVAALWPSQALPYVVDTAEPVDESQDTDPTEFEPQAAAQPPTAVVSPPPPVAQLDEAAPPPKAEHREYQWDGGDEMDEIARQGMEELATCALRPGGKVNSLRPDGMLVGWVVLTEPYIHADGMPVVDIADSAVYAAAQRRKTQPQEFLAEPLSHLMAIDQR